MDCCSGTIEQDDIEILENPDPVEAMKRSRTCTDRGFIFGMAAFFLILFGILGYCIANGDLDRIINGYDDCGNVCGKDNVKTDSTAAYECFGQNMENKKYLLYKTDVRYGKQFVTRTCVESCAEHDAFVDFLNRCYPNSSNKEDVSANSILQKIFEDFQTCWRLIVLLSFLALVFSIIMMILMRYATAFLVWFVLISISMMSIALSVYLWVLFTKANNSDEISLYLYVAIIATIFTIIFLLVVLVMAKRIKLVIQLFKEAAKVIAAIPLLLFQPVVTFLVICFILSMSIYTMMSIASSGYLEPIEEGDSEFITNDPRSLDYTMSGFQKFTSWYNFVAILWIIQFVVGCQHIIIAGCVATWFFARNKENLGTPIITSTLNLLRYHLGTVAVGSLIIAIVQMIRLIFSYIRAAARRKNNIILTLIMCLCSYIFQLIEDFLKYFTRNAYIITAVYGYPFCVSGKRALNILVKNIFNVAAINSVGDYVLFFTKLFVVIFTVFVGTEVFRENDKINYLWFPLTCVGVISYLIAHCFFTVIEMAIDTIFLCFCEDCELNDGYAKPYFMSRNLMEFIENTNKTVNSKNWNSSQQLAWDNGPKRIMLQAS